MRTHVDPNVFLTYRAKDIQTKMSSNPTCIEVDDDPATALKKLDSHDFDQAPVVSDGTVIGWIVRKDIKLDRPVKSSFNHLSHGDLISNEAPLDDALRRLVQRELIFTIGSEGIMGFIVRSDIERHVARAHMYLLISGLEILMTKNVELERLSSEELVQLMSEDSRNAFEKKKARREDANPVEYLNLKALGKATAKNQRIMNHIGMSAKDWDEYIYTLTNIRNWVAHSNTQELLDHPFFDIVQKLNKTEEIIKRLNIY